jgi:hypothetical protein
MKRGVAAITNTKLEAGREEKTESSSQEGEGNG